MYNKFLISLWKSFMQSNWIKWENWIGIFVQSSNVPKCPFWSFPIKIKISKTAKMHNFLNVLCPSAGSSLPKCNKWWLQICIAKYYLLLQNITLLAWPQYCAQGDWHWLGRIGSFGNHLIDLFHFACVHSPLTLTFSDSG